MGTRTTRSLTFAILIGLVLSGATVGDEPAENGAVVRSVVLDDDHVRIVDELGIARPADEAELDLIRGAIEVPARLPAEPSALAWQVVSSGIPEEGDLAAEVTFTPDGSRIIVAHRTSRNLTVFDASTREVLQSISVSGTANSVAVSSDGIHAVTANFFDDTASIVDLVAGTEIAVVDVGDQPALVRITPDGQTAVVANAVSQDLSVIDISSAIEMRRIPGAYFSQTMSATSEYAVATFKMDPFELAPDNQTLILPDATNDRIQFFDITDGTVFSLPSSPGPRTIDLTPDGSLAVVGHCFTEIISVVDVPGRTILRTHSLGTSVYTGNIAIDPSGTKAVVPIQNAAYVVDLGTGALSSSLSTACCLDVTTTADGEYCFAGGFYGSLISFESESIVANMNNVVSGSIVAVSPVEPRAALLANNFGEDLLVFGTNGTSGGLEDKVPSGPPPEGDRARVAAVTPDGTAAVVVNRLSDSVSIIDLPTATVEAIVNVGDRPSDVEVTPDGSLAVVANLDDSFVSVIDMATHTVDHVNISRRGSQVEIAPDGQYAYVAVVADGDGVWRIDLTTLSVAGPKITTGNMGSVSYLFLPSSGMSLSHDGATLVTCNTFNDNVSIIDTAAWQEVARVPVGAYPVRAVFSPDDRKILVTSRDSQTVTVVRSAGALSSAVDSIPVGSYPFVMAVAPDGSRLYVADRDTGNNGHISVIDLVSGNVVDGITLEDPGIMGLHVDATGQELYVASGSASTTFGPGPTLTQSQTGDLFVIDAMSGDILDQVETGIPPAMLAVREADPLAIIPSPGFDVGVALVSLPGGSVAGGRVPDQSDWPGQPLVVNKADGGQITLDWGASCLETDSDYAIYEGMIGAYESHTSKACGTGGETSATLTPLPGSAYYIVVPLSSNREGSYGIDGDGLERPAGGAACLTQQIGECP